MWMMFALQAFAADPTIDVKDDGTVVLVLSVPASETDVRALLADTGGSFAGLFPEVLSVEVQADGPCEKVKRKTPGMFRPLTLLSRRCPTERGWREDLVANEDFQAYATDWIVVGEASGTRIEYRARTVVNLPVPQDLVNESVKKAGLRALVKLQERLR